MSKKDNSKIIKNPNISNIPLKIKPIKAPKKIKQTNIKTSSTITVILVIILLIINLSIILSITTEIESNRNKIPTIPTISIDKIPANSSVLGSWKTSLEGLFTFQDDYTFYWYDSYKYKNDNFYGGTYTYKQGKEALAEMGYTENDFNTSFGEGYTIDKVYSIYLKPSIFIQGGKDLSSTEIDNNETWWFILIIKNDKTALAYNKTLDLRYNLTLN